MTKKIYLETLKKCPRSLHFPLLFTGVLNSHFTKFTKISYSSSDTTCLNLFFSLIPCISSTAKKNNRNEKRIHYKAHILKKKLLYSLLISFRISEF